MPNYRALVAGGFYSSNPFDRSVPVSIRCNNPGAINGAAWERAMPGYVDTVETTPGNKTTIFETPEQGVAVWWELLRRYAASGVDTAGGIIGRYGGGQDYSKYIEFVTERTGFAASKKIDLNDDRVLLSFGRAMFHYEAGRVSPLSDAQILYGFNLGRGKAGPEPAKPATAAPAPSGGGWLAALLSLFSRAAKTAAPQPSTPEKPADPVPWMAKAESYLGFHEKPDNRGIEEFIALARVGSLGDPWCAIFVNACLEGTGVPGSRSAMARSFERNANFVKLSGPAYGAITTMWRSSPTSGLGHVFFYVGENAKGILALGGNQSDQVCKQYEPRNRITGYWWPKSRPLPKVGKIIVDDAGHTTGSET